jgi:ubiquinone/menaquinone biosynthesis C-methylase UbiE
VDRDQGGMVDPHPGSPAWAARRVGQASVYDRIGDRYDEAFPHKEGQLRAGEWLLERLPPQARVLDVGCGTGLPTARQLVEGGLGVTGVDISAVMCAIATRNVPAARFTQADVMSLGPADGPYDAVVAFFSFLNLPRHGIPGGLGLVRRLLVPGGLFSLAMVESDIDDVPIPFLGGLLRVSGYLRDELRSEVEAAGFRVEDETALSYAPATTEAQPEVQLFLNCRRAD